MFQVIGYCRLFFASCAWIGSSLKGDERPAELAWLRMHDATAEMYDDVTKAAFWAGVAYGLGVGHLSEATFPVNWYTVV